MSVIDRLFQLRQTPPFDRLRTDELTVIAGIARIQRWTPGEMLADAGEQLRHLHIIREGAILCGEHRLPPIFGAASILFDRPAPAPLRAAPQTGAAGLIIARSHFFTIANECPSLLVAFFETAGELVSEAP